jgi:hypothetical protein
VREIYKRDQRDERELRIVRERYKRDQRDERELRGAAPTFGIRASFVEVGVFIIVELRRERWRKVCCLVSCATGGKEVMAKVRGHCREEFIIHVRVVDNVRHRWQHGGKSPARCGTSGEQEGESSASCVTKGKHESTSVSRRRACGEGLGGVSLGEASGDGSNRRDKDGIGGHLRVASMAPSIMGFERGINNNKIREVIVGTNLVS